MTDENTEGAPLALSSMSEDEILLIEMEQQDALKAAQAELDAAVAKAAEIKRAANEKISKVREPARLLHKARILEFLMKEWEKPDVVVHIVFRPGTGPGTGWMVDYKDPALAARPARVSSNAQQGAPRARANKVPLIDGGTEHRQALVDALRANGEDVAAVAEQFKVTSSTVWDSVYGRGYKRLTGQQ